MLELSNSLNPDSVFFDERGRKSTKRGYYHDENTLAAGVNYHEVKNLIDLLGNGWKKGLSASQQLSASELKELTDTLPSKKFTVLDLREESHFYVNGFAVSLTNQKNNLNHGKQLSEIKQEEMEIVENLKGKEITLYYREKEEKVSNGINEKMVNFLPQAPITPNLIETEEMLVNRLNGNYVRLPITDHAGFPSTDQIDTLITLHDTQQREFSWIHVHCAAGKGRSSSVITMLAILSWAPTLTLEEIFFRLESRGNRQLLMQGAEKSTHQSSDINFWRDFYDFASTRTENMLWSSWKNEKYDGPIELKDFELSFNIKLFLSDNKLLP